MATIDLGSLIGILTGGGNTSNVNRPVSAPSASISPDSTATIIAAVAPHFFQLLMMLLAKLLEPKAPAPIPLPEPDPDNDDTDVIPDRPPDPILKRRPAKIRAGYTGITRKKQPNVENSGRTRVDAQGFRKVIANQDGLQMGDVIDINITPQDQFGKDFQSGEGANEMLLRKEDGFPGWQIEVEGKGYVVRNQPKPSDPYGCTPGIRIPSTFQDGEVKPGFRGELKVRISLPVDEFGKACLPENAHEVLGPIELPVVRITPWA